MKCPNFKALRAAGFPEKVRGVTKFGSGGTAKKKGVLPGEPRRLDMQHHKVRAGRHRPGRVPAVGARGGKTHTHTRPATNTHGPPLIKHYYTTNRTVNGTLNRILMEYTLSNKQALLVQMMGCHKLSRGISGEPCAFQIALQTGGNKPFERPQFLFFFSRQPCIARETMPGCATTWGKHGSKAQPVCRAAQSTPRRGPSRSRTKKKIPLSSYAAVCDRSRYNLESPTGQHVSAFHI